MGLLLTNKLLYYDDFEALPTRFRARGCAESVQEGLFYLGARWFEMSSRGAKAVGLGVSTIREGPTNSSFSACSRSIQAVGMRAKCSEGSVLPRSKVV